MAQWFSNLQRNPAERVLGVRCKRRDVPVTGIRQGMPVYQTMWLFPNPNDAGAFLELGTAHQYGQRPFWYAGKRESGRFTYLATFPFAAAVNDTNAYQEHLFEISHSGDYRWKLKVDSAVLAELLWIQPGYAFAVGLETYDPERQVKIAMSKPQFKNVSGVWVPAGFDPAHKPWHQVLTASPPMYGKWDTGKQKFTASINRPL